MGTLQAGETPIVCVAPAIGIAARLRRSRDGVARAGARTLL